MARNNAAKERISVILEGTPFQMKNVTNAAVFIEAWHAATVILAGSGYPFIAERFTEAMADAARLDEDDRRRAFVGLVSGSVAGTIFTPTVLERVNKILEGLTASEAPDSPFDQADLDIIAPRDREV